MALVINNVQWKVLLLDGQDNVFINIYNEIRPLLYSQMKCYQLYISIRCSSLLDDIIVKLMNITDT